MDAMMGQYNGRALLVIYTFPPMGGAGVQRATKFAKYLPEFGWAVTVLTVKDVTYHVYDHTLARDVPVETTVERTGSADPLRLAYLLGRLRNRLLPRRPRLADARGAARRPAAKAGGLRDRLLLAYRSLKSMLFVVDPQLLWAPFAVVRGVIAVRRQGVQVVVAMPQPNSTAIIGYLVSRLTGRPLVLDLRDPWTQCPYFSMPTAFHRRINDVLERACFSHARRLVVISDSMRAGIETKYPELKDRIEVITNGHDAADLLGAVVPQRDERFTLAYIGSLYAHHAPVFTTVCQAIATLLAKRPNLRSRFRLRLVGRVEGVNTTLIRDHGLEDVVEVTGYLPHAEAVGHMLAADVLLLLVKDDLRTDRDVVTIPGKFFEYMASRRPILFVGPECEVGAILERTGQGRALRSDSSAISDQLAHYLDGSQPVSLDEAQIEAYDRRRLAERFSMALKRSVELAHFPRAAPVTDAA
jgi:glycosyltransferase involved in cell wall biosynthesis